MVVFATYPALQSRTQLTAATPIGVFSWPNLERVVDYPEITIRLAISVAVGANIADRPAVG